MKRQKISRKTLKYKLKKKSKPLKSLPSSLYCVLLSIKKGNILTQLKILHRDGYSDEEIQSYKSVVYVNTFQSMLTILKAMEVFRVSFGDADCGEHAVKLRAAYAKVDNIDLASDVGSSLVTKSAVVNPESII